MALVNPDDTYIHYQYIIKEFFILINGENIRIKIMKASKSTAKVIGVDEPFKGLSNIEIDAVARYLDKIREKEKTLVVIDHTTGVEDYFSQWIQIENRNNVLSGKILK